MSKRKKAVRKTKLLTKLFRLLGRFKIIFLILALIGLGGLYLLLRELPSPTKLTDPDFFPSSTLIYDRNGKLLYEIYADKNRFPVKLSDLPDHVKWATIAAEDKNFYRHHGFDFGGIFRAAGNILLHRALQGGSTITQQLVKNALLTPERTIQRKIREAVLTVGAEFFYSKDQILEMYLNQTPYGGTAWGIEAAAQTYFGKTAADLDLAQSALLAGLTVSPTRYSPFGAHPELARERQKRVLDQMAESGYISRQEAEQAGQMELNLVSPGNTIAAPHFVFFVKELLAEQFSQRIVEQGGLKVTTTLDLDLQNFAQETVATEVAKLSKLKISNGAALVTNPKTGEILAMVGSKDYFDQSIDGNVNVTLRPRQPGSSIKPINYALALENKLINPATVINDIPTCFAVAGQKLYCPVNYDGQFHGPVQARFALGNSFNIPAVKVLTLNGLDNFIAKCREMGITTFTDPANYGLSLTLGGGEIIMLDFATAFSAFPNLGIRQDVWAIKSVTDQNGQLLYQKESADGPRVLSIETAYIINHILLDNNARTQAFGPSSWLVVKNHPEVSVKTGTTNDLRDNWTIGWTPSRLVSVWVGNNDNTPMSYVASGVTGASPIWNKIITEALKDQKEEWPLRPDAIIGTGVCSLSGQMPQSEGSCPTRFEYFLPGTLPSPENLTGQIEIDKTTNQQATEKTLPENRELQEHQVITDPLGTRLCLDCAFPTEPVIINPNTVFAAPLGRQPAASPSP